MTRAAHLIKIFPRKKILLGAGTLALMLFFSPMALAQVENIQEIVEREIGLTAIPPRLGDDNTLIAQPGETLQVQVRVRNTSQKSKSVHTIVEDFIIGEDGKTPTPVETTANSRWSLAQWMEIQQNEAVVPAGASQTVPIIIRVPADARPGGRYAMVMHQPADPTEEGQEGAEIGGKAAVKQRVGTLVYLRVAGDINEEAHLRNILIPQFSEFGPVPISFEVENLSDIHIRPSTEISITNMLGMRSSDPILVETQNVFPDSQRKFATKWERTWGFGRYTAHFVTSYGEQGKMIKATTHFWMLPYRLIIAVIIFIVLLVGLWTVIRRRQKQKDGLEQEHIDLLEDRIHQLEQELHER
jgi:hypothetical protein